MAAEHLAKLKALSNALERWLEEGKNARGVHRLRQDKVQHYFDTYASIRDALKREHPQLLGDLRERDVATLEHQGARHVEHSALRQLLEDVHYCLDVLSPEIAAVAVPSLKVSREGVFFAGQYFDALKWVAEIVGQAKASLVLIDGYVDASVLSLFSAKAPSVALQVLAKPTGGTAALTVAAQAFQKQYGGLSIRTSRAFHDRFLFVDGQEFYHLGASVKDLGHRGFMFSRIEEPEVLDALRQKWATEWASATVIV